MGNDEGMWSYIARVWMENDILPYTGTIENKTPGIYLIFALSHLLFGPGFEFVRILGLICIFFSGLLIYLLVKNTLNRTAASFSMVFFGLTSLWSIMDMAYIAQTEVFMVFFLVLSFYTATKSKNNSKWKIIILFSGLLMGFAIAFKQTAIFSALALVLFFIIYCAESSKNSRKILGMLLISTGIVAGIILTAVPLFISGLSIKGYIEGAWLILLNKGSSVPINYHLNSFSYFWLNSRFVVFFFVLLFILIKPSYLKNRFFLSTFIWLALDFIGVNASGNYFGHQFRQIQPALSIASGVIIAYLFEEFKSLNQKVLRIKKILLVLLFIIISIPYTELLSGEIGFKNEDKKMGYWLKNHTSKNDYIFFIGYGGNPSLSYSERISSSRYFNYMFITSDKEKSIVLNDLNAKTPKFIIWHKGFNTRWDEIDDYVLKNYNFKCSFENYDIYILKRIKQASQDE